MTKISRRSLGMGLGSGMGLAGLGLLTANSALARGAPKRIYIIAVVPEGTGDVYITGDNDVFGPWYPGSVKMYVDGNRRILPYDAYVGDRLEYKFTQGTWETEAVDESGEPLANFKLTVGDQQIYVHQIVRFKGMSKDVEVKINLTVPEATPTVYITGNLGALGNWDPKAKAMQGSGTQRSFKFRASPGALVEFKFTLGSWETEALGDDGQPRKENFSLKAGAQAVTELSVPGFKS